MRKLPRLTHIRDLEALANALGATCEEEADLRGVPAAEVRAERIRWFDRGQPAAAFLRKWRELNAIEIAAYSRLTGLRPAAIRKALRLSDLPGAIEPLTCAISVSIVAAYDQGFSFGQVQRARKREPVHPTGELLSIPVFDLGEIGEG